MNRGIVMDTAVSKEKKATVAAVAALAGVSPATVSRVLNNRDIVTEGTAARVREAARALGYTLPQAAPAPAPDPVPGSGLILLNFPTMANSFYDEVIKGARSSIRQHGYDAFMVESHINAETIAGLLALIDRYKAAGLITMNHLDTAIGQRLAAAVPMVQCSEYNEEIDTPYVSIDNVEAARVATAHLLSLGRRRIAFLNGPVRYTYARDRLRGYQLALAEAGIPYYDSYVISVPEINGDYAFSAAMQALTMPELPDAVLCASDEFDAPLLRACYQLGLRVPQDVAAVGFDNLYITRHLIPTFSTVSQPKVQLGFLAAEALFEKLTLPNAANKKTLLHTELIIRESSSPRSAIKVSPPRASDAAI